MTSTDIRSRIASMLRCRMSGQLERLLGFFSPRAVVHFTTSREGLFRPAVLQGREALASITRRTDENYTPLEHEILDLLVDGDRAVVRWRGAWRRVANGKIYVLDAAHFLRWENGLVVEMHEFFERMSYGDHLRAPLKRYEDLLAPPKAGLDRAEMERRARAMVDLMSGGPDIAAVREYCSPGIVCDFVGDRARLPYAGRHIGVDALVNIIRAVGVDFEQSNCAISGVVLDGERIAGRRRVEWRHRGTGRRGLVDLSDFLRFENGLIVELIEFRDSLTLLEMQGERDAP